MENIRVPELKALARECGLRNYFQLRKAELIELIQSNQWNTNPALQSWEPQKALNQPPIQIGALAPRSVETSTTSTNSNLGTYR